MVYAPPCWVGVRVLLPIQPSLFNAFRVVCTWDLSLAHVLGLGVSQLLPPHVQETGMFLVPLKELQHRASVGRPVQPCG